MATIPLDAMFNPGSVAVFGASQSGKSVGAQVFRNLVRGGFKGRIVPVNPKHKTVGGMPCVASVKDAEPGIDLAVIATPAETIPGIFRDCADAGIRNAIVLSAGFGENGGEGRVREAEIEALARKHDIRFMGPNCVGLARPWNALDATFLRASTPKGRLALISQSGALCSAISDWAEPNHLGFSALVSLGNSVNVDFGDVLQFLIHDPKTDAILIYVEGIRDARSFVSALRAAAKVKPVIVLKSGRHTQSAKAANTHTGALLGSDVTFEAALERTGAVRVSSFGQLFAAAEILAAGRRSGGGRLGIITNGGGAGVLAADQAGDLRLELPSPSPKTVETLDAQLPAYWSKANPLDILGDAEAERFGKATSAALADPNFDGVLVMLTPQAMTDATGAAKALIAAVPPRSRKPVLACWMGESSVGEARTLLNASGIPDFATPELAVEAFSFLAQQHRNRMLALETPGPRTHDREPDFEGARMIVNAALADGRSLLSDVESKALLRAFHIPVNITLTAATADEALVAAETVGFPIVMKINSPDITHKSDVGGVRTNIMNAGDAKHAFAEIVAHAGQVRPDARIKGVTVEPMAAVETARELVVGASRDPVFGPAILFGAGGTMVEVLNDNAVALPPLTEVLANRLIDRTRVSRLLKSFRDQPAVDRKAVVDVLLCISNLVCEMPEIVQLDINPLFAGPDGVLAVDARIGIARPPAKDGHYDHMAIHPYPRHLVWEGHLQDGTPLTIRPIRPEDAESEQTFVRELSAEAKQFRFMGTVNELSREMLVRFTQIDYHREMALIAVTEEYGAKVQQGVARYVINPDGTSCEFAIVVSDRIRHQGLGTRLMKALMDAARDRGLKLMQGTVLANNAAMLKLTQELGFTQVRSADDKDIVDVERQL